jgi:hypothetical protein
MSDMQNFQLLLPFECIHIPQPFYVTCVIESAGLVFDQIRHSNNLMCDSKTDVNGLMLKF